MKTKLLISSILTSLVLITTKMSGLLKAFKKKYAKKAKEFTFYLKCVGLD